MSYYEKYLKYKNKYFYLKNILGGTLKKEKKKNYIQLLHKLYTKPFSDSDAKTSSEILKELLKVAYEESQKIFKIFMDSRAELPISQPVSTIEPALKARRLHAVQPMSGFSPAVPTVPGTTPRRLPAVPPASGHSPASAARWLATYVTGMVRGETEAHKNMLRQRQHMIEISEKNTKIYSEAMTMIGNPGHILDIPEFNVRSLQIVILYTELIKMTEKDTTRTNMLNYFQQPYYRINEEYDNLCKVFDNYDELFSRVCNSIGFKDIVYERYSESTLISYKNIKKSRIICYLDYISEKEIVFSYVHDIYYLGISEKLDYADGREMTPFEFLHHDITHANNRGYPDGFDIELEKEFYDYLETQGLSPEAKKQIYIIFFLIVHESANEYLIGNRIEIKDSDDFYSLVPRSIQNMDNWTSPNFYNGLLPSDLREVPADQAKIRDYLTKSFAAFKTEWNNFVAITKQ